MMHPVLAVPIVAPTLAGFADVFQIVVGVILALSGLGLLFMGLIAVADRAWKHGAIATLLALALLIGGLALVGVF